MIEVSNTAEAFDDRKNNQKKKSRTSIESQKHSERVSMRGGGCRGRSWRCIDITKGIYIMLKLLSGMAAVSISLLVLAFYQNKQG